MKGGFKVLVNGNIVRCTKIQADFDEGTFHFDNNEIGESFDREKFAVMTVTSEDKTD